MAETSETRPGAYARMTELGRQAKPTVSVTTGCNCCGPRTGWYTIIAVLASVVLVGAIVAFVLVNMSVDSCQWDNFRLPRWISPRTYLVRWKPSMNAGGPLTGSIAMTGVVLYPGVGCVVLNSVGFTFPTASVTIIPKNSPKDYVPVTRVVDPSTIKIMEENQQIAVPIGTMLNVDDQIVLNLAFSGTMSDTLNGMYLSTSTDANGDNNTVIVTQFEATYARKAFPCLDEPEYKAQFTVTLDGIDPNLAALSNMPVSSVVPYGSNGQLTYEFQPSVPMSTYLVAVVVGKFEATWETYVSPLDANRTVNVSVWAPPGNQNRLLFAVDCARLSLAAYESTFGVPFPLPEMKMAAIASFAAGAMENWGLVTYRLTALLADPAEASQASMQRVAVVVAHELAHQWFGNLVTTMYWNQLFLNEGFATLIEFLGTEASHPEFHIWDEFLGGDVHRAMRVDDLASVSPLVNPNVDSSGAIESQFNDIAYSKGGSVLRMLWKFMDSSPLTSHVKPSNDDAAPAVTAYGRGLLLDNDDQIAGNDDAAGGSDDAGGTQDDQYKNSVFFGGLKEYLLTYQYDVATADQLVSILADYSQYNQLNADMSTWTHQPGVPLVIFSWQTGGATTESGNLCISQRRLFRSQYSRELAASTQYGNDQVYWIPLNFVVENSGPKSKAQAAATSLAASGGFRNQTYGCFQYNVQTDGYIKANNGSFGYYRVAYPDAVWKSIAVAVEESIATASNSAVFDPQDRAGLLDDILTVAETSADAPIPPEATQLRGLSSSSSAGAAATKLQQTNYGTSITTALDYMATLRTEAAYPVWRSAITHISRILAMLVPEGEPGNPLPPHDLDPCPEQFKAYANNLTFDVLLAIGNDWGNISTALKNGEILSAPERDEDLEALELQSARAALVARKLMSSIGARGLREYRLRADDAVFKSAIVSLAASMGNGIVVNRTIDLWLGGIDGIDPNYLGIVAASYVRAGGQQEWNNVRDAYNSATEAYSKSVLLSSLSQSANPTVLQGALQFAMSSDVDPQDTVTLLAGVCNNPTGKGIAWEYLTQPAIWNELVKRYGSGGFSFSQLVLSMGANFGSQLWFDEVESFFAQANLEAGAEEAAQALEIIQSHMSFTDSQHDEACGWLADNVSL